MSILQIIAIAGVLLGAVSFVIEIRQKGKKSIAIFIALIIVSAALFVVSGIAKEKLETRQMAQVESSESVEKEDAAVAKNEKDVPAEDEFLELNAPIDLSDVQEDDETVAPKDTKAAAPAENAQADAPAENAQAAAPAENAQAAAPAENAQVAAPAENAQAAAPAENAQAAAPAEAAPAENAQAAAPAEAAPAENAQADAPEAVKHQNSKLAPIADAGSPMDDAKLNEEIDFSAKKSHKHPDGADIVSYKWDFGDGTSADTSEAKHAYGKVGTYIATLTVIDADGHFGIATRQIDVVRPERRITFIEKKLPDLKDAKESPDAQTGTYQKAFTGSKLYLEVSGYILSAEGCECELAVSLNGPGCATTKRKKLSDGGEGDISVKAVCSGELGEHTWKVERKVSDNCTCTFTKTKFEGSES